MEPVIQQEDGSSVTSTIPAQLFSEMPSLPNMSSLPAWVRDLEPEQQNGIYLIQLLLSCADYICNGTSETANLALEYISQLASADGNNMQRVASYFAEGLAERLLKTWNGLYRALTITRTNDISEEIAARKLCFDLFPFLKLAYVVTNQSILEAMEGEKVVHIIDLNASDHVQWVALLQALSARGEGPPHVRITGVHHQKEVLDQVGQRLSQEAERLDLAFQFNPVVCSKLDNLDIEQLRVKTGEAVAICSVLQLHTILASDDETVRRSSSLESIRHVNQCSTSNDSGSSSPHSSNGSIKVNRFLRALWGLSPQIMVVTEQDANHNGTSLLERLAESMHFYASLFDCLESTVPRSYAERRKVEKMVLGEEIKNIMSCEGLERKERHEKMDKWAQRLEMAGFGNVPFSFMGVLQARQVLHEYGFDGYGIKEVNGCLFICWHERPLFAVSSWRRRR